MSYAATHSIQKFLLFTFFTPIISISFFLYLEYATHFNLKAGSILLAIATLIRFVLSFV
jgi:hypothetical protein